MHISRLCLDSESIGIDWDHQSLDAEEMANGRESAVVMLDVLRGGCCVRMAAVPR